MDGKQPQYKPKIYQGTVAETKMLGRQNFCTQKTDPLVEEGIKVVIEEIT